MSPRFRSITRLSHDTDVSLAIRPSAISQSNFLLYSSKFPQASSPTIASYNSTSPRQKHHCTDRRRVSGHFKSAPRTSSVPHATGLPDEESIRRPVESPPPRMRPEDPYLSYHDVLLRKEDIDTLRNDWLTDNVISFCEEYLEHETLSKHKDAHVVLLRPSMTSMLFLSQDPLSLKEALPSFEGVSHIFLPINDNTDRERAEGGSHWSLLVVSTADKTAFHYDSLCSVNEREGRAVTNNMSKLLGVPLKYLDLEDAPQQTNSSDCGVFVCMIMTHLLVSRLLTKPKGEQVSMSIKNKSMDARHGRKHLLKLIENFRKEGERRRSSGSGSPRRHHDDFRSSSRSTSASRSPPRID